MPSRAPTDGARHAGKATHPVLVRTAACGGHDYGLYGTPPLSSARSESRIRVIHTMDETAMD
jgi:hypothetical protein